MQPVLFHFQAFELASTTLQRVVCLVSHCARPTRAFSGRALREHRTTRIFPIYLSPSRGAAWLRGEIKGSGVFARQLMGN